RQSLAVGNGAGMKAGRKEGQLMTFIVGIAPGQDLWAGRLENIMGAAIAERMQRKLIAVPDQRAARRFGLHLKIVEHDIQIEGKARDGLLAPGNGDPGDRLMP